MRLGAELLRAGEVAPASGPRRVEFLTRRGRAAVGHGLTGHAAVLDAVGRFTDIDTLPYARPGSPNEDRDLLVRAASWDRVRLPLLIAMPPDEYAAAEKLARSSLDSLIDGYRDLRAVDAHERAHRRMHRVGELVNGLFLCMYAWDAQLRVWMDRCPVRHGHSDVGISAGMTSRELCSLCGLDAADCSHLPGAVADVVAAAAPDGTCNVCAVLSGCAHAHGRTYPAIQRIVRTDAALREATMLNRPRDPRLRFTRTECTEPIPPPRPGRPPLRRCLACFVACDDPRRSGEGSAVPAANSG